MAANLRDALWGRGVPVACVFSTGNEVSVCAEDVMEAFIADEQIRTLTVYVEQIRQPGRFLALAAKARLANKPIVLLMPGRSARAREAAQSHTGALAGDHATAMACLRREAVVTVESLDELLDVTAVLLRFPAPPVGGIAFMTGSGAMKNIALDFAEDLGLELPALSQPVVEKLTAMLPAYAVPLFVRIIGAVEATSTFKNRKVELRDEGYGEVGSDPLYVFAGRSGGYVESYDDYAADVAAARAPRG